MTEEPCAKCWHDQCSCACATCVAFVSSNPPLCSCYACVVLRGVRAGARDLQQHATKPPSALVTVWQCGCLVCRLRRLLTETPEPPETPRRTN